MKKLLLLAILAIMGVASVLAQVTTSSMSGKVTDSNGMTVVGSTVVAIHTPSGTQYGAVVDANGTFRLLNMRPGGPYTVQAQMIGYNTAQFNSIELALGDTYVLDFSLTESAIGMEEVVVIGSGRDNMNTDRAGAITSVNSKAMAAQPTVSRSLNDIIKLAPQASVTQNGLAVGGGNFRQSYVTVDGAAFNNAFGIGGNLPANGSPISIDALEQVSVSVTPYDVRQSGFTGGAINAVTKSGDNEFRGTAYTYMNNERFKGTKVRDGEVNVSEQKYLMYGMSVGGPIIKNKLFFFVNAEYENETSPGPTARARANASANYGTSYGVNRPTVGQMDEVRSYLQSKYNYDPGSYQEYSYDTPGFKLLARVDWNINNDHKLNVRYSTTKSKSASSMSSSMTPMSGALMYGNNSYRNGVNGMSTFYNSKYWEEQNFNSVAAELNSQFSGGISNTLRATYSRQHEPRSYDGGFMPLVDILENDGSANTPLVSFGIDPFTYGNLRDVKTLVITDDVNWTWGRHNMTAGLQYEFNRTENGFMRLGAGWYVYESWDDFVNGNKPISFAITHPNNKEMKQVNPSFDYTQYSVYLQDKFDISNNFKLTAGLRVEVPVFPSLKDNYNEKFAALKFKDGVSYSTDQLPKARVQFSPRIGFNWDLTGDRTHVIRGGTGIFTGRLPFVWLISAMGNSGVGQVLYSASVTEVAGGKKVPGFHTNLEDILKDVYGGSYVPENNLDSGSTILSDKLKMPGTWKTSLAYDVRLPWGINGSVEGIFNKDMNSVYINNVGLKDPIKNGLTLSKNDVRDKADGYYNVVDGTNINAYLLENAKKDGWYYSVTVKLEKTFNFGLSAMAAYTRSDSRVLSDGIGDQVNSAWRTNINAVGMTNDATVSYGSFVSPNRLIASVSFQRKGTGITLFYEGYNLGYMGTGAWTYTRYSYTYDGNVVGDGGANTLLYVPASKDELKFSDYTLNGETYTAAQQANDFWAYVNQDKYLKTRKGKYAERNGAIMPWRSRFDLKFTQDYVLNANGKKNVLQVGVDVNNFANLFYKKWGNVRTIANNAPLRVVTDRNTGEITYNFKADGTDKLTRTSNPVARYASTYSFQLSFRYIFN